MLKKYTSLRRLSRQTYRIVAIVKAYVYVLMPLFCCGEAIDDFLAGRAAVALLVLCAGNAGVIGRCRTIQAKGLVVGACSSVGGALSINGRKPITGRHRLREQ